MKKTITLSIILFSLPCANIFALNLKDAPIQQVTLYPTSAKIERTLPVQSGEQFVTLDGIAANFDMSQLQYQTINIDVNAISHSDSALNKPSGKESQELNTQIEIIQNKISEQNAIIQASQLLNKFLGNITKGSPSKVRKQAYDAFIAIDQATLAKGKLEQRQKELQQDLNAIGDHTFNQRSIKFYVNAPQKGSIKLSYMVPYARWQPTYKAELDTKSKQVKLTQMAMIAQKTGEDWNNVNLILSTAKPQDIVEQQSPEVWWVDYYEPESIQPKITTSQRSMSPRTLRRVHEKEEMNASPFPQFEAHDLNFSTEFSSETKASISSSQQQIYLPLSTEKYLAKLSIWTIPKHSLQATINAEIEKFDSNWPAGNIKIYRDGDYIGQRNWKNHSSESLFMDFGTDEQVTINVIDLADKKNAVGVSQSETIQKQQYQIQNLHTYPIQVQLFDPLPQSRNSKLITQSTYSQKPNATTWLDQPNINQWFFDLKPQQQFKLDVQHQFKYPNNGRTEGF